MMATAVARNRGMPSHSYHAATARSGHVTSVKIRSSRMARSYTRAFRLKAQAAGPLCIPFSPAVLEPTSAVEPGFRFLRKFAFSAVGVHLASSAGHGEPLPREDEPFEAGHPTARARLRSLHRTPLPLPVGRDLAGFRRPVAGSGGPPPALGTTGPRLKAQGLRPKA